MNNNNPKVSILISVYNGEKNIDQCLESVKDQTYKNLEVICVNDASRDETSAKLTEWQKVFDRDKFILINNQANLGLTKSLNIALSKASGKYIARIDADDTWSREKLARQVEFMEKNPEYGIVGTNHINIYKDNVGKKYIKLPETYEAISQKLFRRNPFAHSCILAKTDLLKNVGGYDESVRYGQDYDLWLRCFPKTKFYNIQEFFCSRAIDNGISVRKQNKQMWQSIKTRIKYINKYNYSWKNYLYLLEPLIIIIIPDLIKNWKRKYL